MPLLGLGVWQVPDGPACVHAVRAALELGIPPHRHRAGVRKRVERRPRTARERHRARRGVHHDEVLPRPARSAQRGRLQHRAARGRLRRPVHRPLARQAGPPGPGPGWRPRMRAATPARSASPTSTSTSSIRCIAGATVAPVVDQVQFNPSAYRKALLDACDERAIALEAYSPLGTGSTAGRPRSRGYRRAPRAKPCPDPAALVCPARHPGHRQVNPSRPHRGERADLRLRARPPMTMEELDALDRSGGTRAALERKWW